MRCSWSLFVLLVLQLVRVWLNGMGWDGMGRAGDEDPLEAVSHHHQLLNGELDSLALGIPTEGREGLI